MGYSLIAFYQSGHEHNQAVNSTDIFQDNADNNDKKTKSAAVNVEYDDRSSRSDNASYNMTSLLTGLLVLLFFSGILFFNLYRNKNRANEELNRKNHEINFLNDQLKSQNELLSKSETELKSANEAKDKFFSIIAHDLMNPNQTLLGYAQLLKDDIESYPPEEIREICENICKTTENQKVLLQNLLTWARSQTGRIELNSEDFPLSEIIFNTLGPLQTKADQKKIRISVQVNEQIMVYADTEMVMTILRNLISNALKFTQRNGLVEITAEEIGELVKITIRDTGVGMEESTLASLFCPGAKVSTLGTSNEAGTGLGLIICQEFVELNGGKIWAESQVNKGSKFNFTLPNSKNHRVDHTGSM